jgi:hypothetical protein
MDLKTFIGALRTETLGLSFGDPWRSSDSSISCVVPILRDLAEDPKYQILAKAKSVKVIDSGSINKVLVTNEGLKPVFIRTGEIFKGATQERASTTSHIIMPGEKVEVDVVCVHASKGIHKGTSFTSHGYTPNNREAFFVGNAMKGMGGGTVQAASWQMDRGYTETLCTTFNQPSAPLVPGDMVEGFSSAFDTKADDLSAARDKAASIYKDLVAQVPLYHNQIGMAIIDDKGFYSLDCYDLHLSWKDVKEAIVGKEVLALAQEDSQGVFTYNPERAKSVIQQALEVEYVEKEIISHDKTKVIALDGTDFIGEATLLDDELIHLLISRK